MYKSPKVSATPHNLLLIVIYHKFSSHSSNWNSIEYTSNTIGIVAAIETEIHPFSDPINVKIIENGEHALL